MRKFNLLIVFVMMLMVFNPIAVNAETAETMEMETISETITDTKEWITKGWNRVHKDEVFQSEKILNRGEFLALINSLYEIKDQKEINFIDVPQDSVYYKEVSRAFNAGYVLGNGDNTFKPEKEITNVEIYIMISRILKLDTEKQPEKIVQYKDHNEVPDWALGYIEAFLQKGYLDGKNKIKPFEKITGADAVALLETLETVSGINEVVPEDKPIVEEVKGNGKSPLNLLEASFVSINENQSVELGKLEDGNTTDEIIIKLVFDRGIVREYWENNQAQIKLQSKNGEVILSEVFRIEETDAEKEHIFIKPLETIKSGKVVNIVIGADLKANNGNSLGQSTTVSFVVK